MKQPLIFTKLQLLAAARRADCCRQYQMRIIKAGSKDDLMRTYIDGLRFCLANDYPDKGYILRHFDKGMLHRYGIFVDERTTDPGTRTIVALGGCTGTLEFGGHNDHRVAVKHDSAIDLRITDHAFVIVYLYDRAKVNIHLDGHASVVVYYYEDAERPAITRVADSRSTFKIIHRDILPKM